MEQQRKILLSVTGMSPSVVTETLYALVTEKGFIPTEIQVITTEQGKNKLLQALLGVEGGRKERKGALQEFIDDYGEKHGFSEIHFDENCVHIIQDASGQNLPDIRTPEENEYAANNIVQLVGKLCQNDDTALHVSIAGGRKTMGFFMGYALSLYGRKQDSLSHVLVDEQYENLPSFYYPKPYSHLINDLKGNQIDVKDSKVMLAEIPWVRLGLGISDELMNQKISYSESIHKAQSIWQTPHLTFLYPMDKRLVKFGDKEIKLSPRGYSLLLSLVISKYKSMAFGIYPKGTENYSKDLYHKIYLLLKDEIPIADLQGILNDSRTDIVKKVQKEFSLGKGTKTAYIPELSTACYQLNIDLSEINIQAIKHEINHLL